VKRGLAAALVFLGTFLGLTALIGLIGLLGSWELLVIALVAALVTFVVARSGSGIWSGCLD
jgi:hypothetical protein